MRLVLCHSCRWGQNIPGEPEICVPFLRWQLAVAFCSTGKKENSFLRSGSAQKKQKQTTLDDVRIVEITTRPQEKITRKWPLTVDKIPQLLIYIHLKKNNELNLTVTG